MRNIAQQLGKSLQSLDGNSMVYPAEKSANLFRKVSREHRTVRHQKILDKETEIPLSKNCSRLIPTVDTKGRRNCYGHCVRLGPGTIVGRMR